MVSHCPLMVERNRDQSRRPGRPSIRLAGGNAADAGNSSSLSPPLTSFEFWHPSSLSLPLSQILLCLLTFTFPWQTHIHIGTTKRVFWLVLPPQPSSSLLPLPGPSVCWRTLIQCAKNDVSIFAASLRTLSNFQLSPGPARSRSAATPASPRLQCMPCTRDVFWVTHVSLVPYLSYEKPLATWGLHQ